MNKLILFVVVAVAFALASAEIDRSKFKKAHDECQEDPKTKISQNPDRRPGAGERQQDPNAAAHSLCMSKKLGYQDADGKVVKSAVKEGLEKLITDGTKVEDSVADCAVDKETPEATALNLWHCMRKFGPKPPRPQH